MNFGIQILFRDILSTRVISMHQQIQSIVWYIESLRQLVLEFGLNTGLIVAAHRCAKFLILAHTVVQLSFFTEIG